MPSTLSSSTRLAAVLTSPSIEYDKLVEQARNEYANDPAKRRQALIQAEVIGIKQDAVAAPIYQSATSYLLKARVKNFEVMPFGRTINLRPVYVTE